ncbi:MAG: iron-siderophore ABC transporter substrate-binding protein [Cyanobacteria bacterium J06639_16]
MKRMQWKIKTWSRGLGQITLGFAIAAALITCHRHTPPVDQSAESPSAATEDCQVINHDAGETSVCGQPKNVVTVGPNMLELLLALDVQPMGHAEYFPFPIPAFDQPEHQIPYLGVRLIGQPRNIGTAHTPALEVIAELKPDLILGDSLKNQDEYELLSQIAPTLLFNYDDPNQDWQSDLRAIAQALNLSERAETVIVDARDRQAALRTAIAPRAAQTPNALLLLGQQLDQELQIETRHSACGSLLEALGFQVVVPEALENSREPSHAISLEALPELDADLIIVEGFNREVNLPPDDPIEGQLQAIKQQWQTNAIAQSLPASQNNRVYFTTVYLCHALLGPIGTEIFLEQLHQQLTIGANDAKISP